MFRSAVAGKAWNDGLQPADIDEVKIRDVAIAVDEASSLDFTASARSRPFKRPAMCSAADHFALTHSIRQMSQEAVIGCKALNLSDRVARCVRDLSRYEHH